MKFGKASGEGGERVARPATLPQAYLSSLLAVLTLKDLTQRDRQGRDCLAGD